MHKLYQKLGRLNGGAIVPWREIQVIAVNEPANHEAVDDEELAEVVVETIPIMVSDHIYFEQLRQTSKPKYCKEYLQPPEDWYPTLISIIIIAFDHGVGLQYVYD